MGVASTEPAQYGRDDWSIHSTGVRPIIGLNGARPVRAGRRRERGFAGQLCDLASTEPAQYGRDDDAAYAGGCFRRRFFASTEPAQYGRDDQSPSG